MPTPLLSGEVIEPRGRERDLDMEVRNLRGQLSEAQMRLMEAGERYATLRQDFERQSLALERLQHQLSPLYDVLRIIFGDLADFGAGGASGASGASGADPRTQAVWKSWKDKLGGLAAQAIDVLMLHGEMNQTQLRLHLGCSTRSVPNVVLALNKAGLIVKSGGKISLKQL